MKLKQGSVFFITGAAGGIGAELARLVVSRGHRAVLADIEGARLNEPARELGESALAVQMDVREPADWQKALDATGERFGRLDVLVNNAAVLYCDYLRNQTRDEFQHMLDVNVHGLLLGMQAAMPRMTQQGHGHIVNVGSIAGFIPAPGQAFYACTKHAVRALHHAFAFENRAEPVQYTLVCPGAVETDMIRGMEGKEAGALAFADPSLQPAEVARAIYRGVEKKKLQVIIPGLRGGLLRLLGGFPSIILAMLPGAFAGGLKKMARRSRSEAAAQ